MYAVRAQGMVKQWQDLFYAERYSGTEQFNPDFVKLAEVLAYPCRTSVAWRGAVGAGRCWRAAAGMRRCRCAVRADGHSLCRQ